MSQLPASFIVGGSGHLIASVTGTGDGLVENGLPLQSASFSSIGSVDLDLGAAVQSVSSFKFILGSDTADFVVSVGTDQAICVLLATGEMVATGPTPDDPSVVSRFINGISQTNVTAVLTGAFESRIEANATGVPTLILVGLVSGEQRFS